MAGIVLLLIALILRRWRGLLVFRWWRLHLLIRRRHLRGPRGDHQGHGHLQVVGFHAIAAAEGGMGLGHPHGIELGAVAFHAAADRFGDQVFDLLTADLHIRQPLAGQQQLGRESIGFLPPFLGEGAAALAMADHGVGDLHPLFGAHQLVGRKCDGKAIQQVIADIALFGVVGGDQQGPAGMAEAETFPLHAVLAAAHGRQHQIDDSVIQKVELVDVENPTVSIRQKTGLKHGAAAGEGGGDIHSTHQAVFGDAQRDLNEGGGDHLRRWFVRDPLPGGVIPFLRVLRIEVAADASLGIEDIDRWQQGMQASRQDRFAGAASTRNHDASQAWVDRR